MTDDPAKLLPADPDELRLALSLALQRDRRRRFRHGDDLMAKLVADHLVRCLQQSNYVIMRRPPRPGHSTSAGMRADRSDLLPRWNRLMLFALPHDELSDEEILEVLRVSIASAGRLPRHADVFLAGICAEHLVDG